MNSISRAKLFIVALFSSLIFNGLSIYPVFANNNLPKVKIQISPTDQRFSLNPGDHYSGSFKVQNVGSDKFDFRIKASPYQVIDENYSAVFNQRSQYTQISEWISFGQNHGTLNPGQTVDIAYTVRVPLDVPAGGQYAAISAETDNPESSGSSIKVVSRVAMIVYSRVNGKTRESAKVLNNDISGFFLKSPLSATSLVENTGNVDVTAKYTLKVSLPITGSEVYSNAEKPIERTILPETKRFSTTTWENAPLLGLFNVEQIVEIPGQPASITKKLVLICPIWLLMLIFIAIIVIAIHISMRRKSKRG